MAEHTKEPWHDHPKSLSITSADAVVAFTSFASVNMTEEKARANARRIVACVNACAGIPTEALEARELLALRNLCEIVADDAEYKWASTMRQALDTLSKRSNR